MVCRIGRIQEAGYRTGGIQDRWDTGKERCRKEGLRR